MKNILLTLLFILAAARGWAQPACSLVGVAPCEGASVGLLGCIGTANDPVVSWDWSFPGGIPSSSIQQNPMVQYSTAGSYTITEIVTTQQGKKDTVQQQVTVYANPVAGFSTSINGSTVQFLDSTNAVSGNIVSWSWTFPGATDTISGSAWPKTSYPLNGTYTACVVVCSNYGCRDTFCDQVVITQAFVIEPCISSPVIVFPSPSNGELHVRSQALKLHTAEVYNLVGEKVYERLFQDKSQDTWDLSFHQDVPEGVYFLKLKTDSEIVTKKIIIAK